MTRAINTNYGTTYNNTLAGCSEYENKSARLQRYQAIYGKDSNGNSIDYKSALFMNGVDGDASLQHIEDWLEGGGSGDGVQGNLLSWNRCISSANNIDNKVFQSSNGATYTNINFNKGYYNIWGEQEFAYQTGAFGSDLTNKPYNVVTFGQEYGQFVEYKWSGTGDGQDFRSMNLSTFSNTAWSKNTYYTVKEFDASQVLFNQVDNPTNAQSLATATFSEMKATTSQWMSSSDKQYLSQYKEGTANWNYAFLALAQARLDNETGYGTGWLS